MEPEGSAEPAARRAFGDDVRTPAEATAPLFGARPPGVLVRLAKLLAGRSRTKPTKAEAAVGVPDPAHLFPAPRYAADGAAIDGHQAEHYELVARELRQEADELDVASADKATALGGDLARSILDQMEASAIYNIAAILRGIIMLGLVFFAAGLSWRIASDLDPAPFSYATLYALLGLFGVLAAGAAADGAAAAAKKRFARAAGALETLVAQATGRFRDRLIEQRAAMQLNSAADLPGAIAAAARARMTTVAGLRFYAHAPVIGAEGEGHRCHVLGAAIAGEAQRRLGVGTRFLGRFSALIFGVAIGIVLLFFSIAGPVALMPAPPFLAELASAEAARPGIVSFAFVMAAAIFAPHLLGPMAAQVVSADDPAGALGRYGLDSVANGLKDRTLSAAAERPREMIERFADALLALEKRADAWSKTGSRFDETAPNEDLSWRKAPEGPRFVAQSFASAPPKFVANAEAPARRGFFSKSAHPDPAPKQAFGAIGTPPWLKN